MYLMAVVYSLLSFGVSYPFLVCLAQEKYGNPALEEEATFLVDCAYIGG
jgi:hypothetical protein